MVPTMTPTITPPLLVLSRREKENRKLNNKNKSVRSDA